MYKMRLHVFFILLALLASLVSAAPQDQSVSYRPESEQYGGVERVNFTTIVENTTIVEDEEYSGDKSSTEEKHEDSNDLGCTLCTQQVSQSKEALETTAKETEEETPTKREELNQTAGEIQSESTQQVNEVSITQNAEQPVAGSETLVVSGETSAESTTKVPTATTTKRPKPSKPKPQRATTLKPLAAESPVTPVPTTRPTSVTVKPTKPTSTQRYPCRCADGTCSCCTGIVLENFNVPLRSRACANVTYEPDEFAFNFKLAYNNIVLYNRRMSAKNPRPACIPINRYFGIKMCAKLSNVYLSGRNMHACLEFEGFFDDETAFKYPFNCFRVGSQGVAVVRPEDGGGLPPPPDEEEQTDEEYDDSARGWESESDYDDDDVRGAWEAKVQVVPN